MTISTNQKTTIYRNLYENTGPGRIVHAQNGQFYCIIWFENNPVYANKTKCKFLP